MGGGQASAKGKPFMITLCYAGVGCLRTNDEKKKALEIPVDNPLLRMCICAQSSKGFSKGFSKDRHEQQSARLDVAYGR